jgi:hypothetical protein
MLRFQASGAAAQTSSASFAAQLQSATGRGRDRFHARDRVDERR